MHIMGARRICDFRLRIFSADQVATLLRRNLFGKLNVAPPERVEG